MSYAAVITPAVSLRVSPEDSSSLVVSGHNYTSPSSSSSSWVSIVGGKHKGKTLRFIKRTAQRIAVQREDDDGAGKVIYLLPEHVRMMSSDDINNGITAAAAIDERTTTTTALYTAVSSSSSSSSSQRLMSSRHRAALRDDPTRAPSSPRWVSIVDGKHRGKTVRFLKRTAQRCAIQLEDGKVIYLLPSHIGDMTTTTTNNNNNNIPSGEIVTTGNPLFTSRTTVHDETTSSTRVDEEDQNNDPIIIISDDEEDDDDFATAVMEEEDYDDDRSSSFELISTVEQQQQQDEQDASLSLLLSVSSLSSLQEGDRIRITGGVHQGKNAIFVKRTPQRVAVRLEQDDETKVRYLMPNCLLPPRRRTRDNDDQEHHDDDDDDPAVKAFRDSLRRLLLPEGSSSSSSSNPATATATRAVVRVHNSTVTKGRSTLMGAIFGRDVVSLFLEVGYSSTAVRRIPKELTTLNNNNSNNDNNNNNNNKFFLAAMKVHQDDKTVTCAYLRANSHRQVASRLLQLGAFDKLIPRKVAARLELLLSSASSSSTSTSAMETNNVDDVDVDGFHIHSSLTASDFSFIPEAGNVGCGFIPSSKIQELLGGEDNSMATEDVFAIQVRIAIPTMGIFKGVLMEKQGIDKIQLPPSMKKVEASANSDDPDSSAFLIINQSGVYPYATRIQRGECGFHQARPFPEMAKWMLIQKGVSNSYLCQDNRCHDTCKGVADPTDAIPSGCIFLTGIQQHHDSFPDRLVISRYPMTEASDGRVVPIVKEKPAAMSTSDWEFLSKKKFGAVLFGAPPPGQPSMPETIAQGDLDGDDYFICWDPIIVQDALIGDPPVIASKNNNSRRATPPDEEDDSWWIRTVEFMVDMESRKRSQRLISALHTMWRKRLKEGMQQESRIFGRAFKESIDVTKHGGKVALPTELWKHIEYNLRCYLKPP
jgi:hypothetical protein